MYMSVAIQKVSGLAGRTLLAGSRRGIRQVVGFGHSANGASVVASVGETSDSRTNPRCVMSVDSDRTPAVNSKAPFLSSMSSGHHAFVTNKTRLLPVVGTPQHSTVRWLQGQDARSNPARKTKHISTGNSDLDKVFQGIQDILSPDLVKSTNGIFEFDFKDGGTFFLDLKNGSGDIGQGKPDANPDVIMTMKTANFLKMTRGEFNPVTGSMSGKLKLEGDMKVAAKLEAILKQVQHKLD